MAKEDYTSEPVLHNLSTQVGKLEYNMETLTNVSPISYTKVVSMITNYPELCIRYGRTVATPADILTPHYLDELVKSLNNTSILFLELLSFIHSVSVIDIFFNNGDGNGIINTFVKAVKLDSTSIKNSDTIAMSERPRKSLSIGKTITISDLDDIPEVQRLVMGFYMFCSICHIENIDISKVVGDVR